MNIAISILLSLTTIVGGHFYNKRNDRAILFLGAFFAWFIFAITFLPFIYEKLDRLLDDTTVFLYLKFGVLFIWAISALMTYFDARIATEKINTKTSISWKFGATILSLFMGVVTFSVLSSFFHGSEFSKIKYDSYQESVENNFRHHIGLGSARYPEPKYTTPPKGQGTLRVRFIYEDQPVDNLKLKLILNGKYKTKLVETDRDGQFSLKLPYGIWYLNSVETTSWPEKPPKTNFIILSGLETSLEQYQKNPHWFPGGNGLQFQLSEEIPHKNIKFKIVPQINLLWPGPRGRELKASNDSIIHWDPYPSASQYLVWVQSIESNLLETKSTYYAALSTIVKGTNKLALSEITTPDDSKNYYQIMLFAFNEAGDYLSESKIKFNKGSSFVLDGYKIESEEIRKRKERYNRDIKTGN